MASDNQCLEQICEICLNWTHAARLSWLSSISVWDKFLNPRSASRTINTQFLIARNILTPPFPAQFFELASNFTHTMVCVFHRQLSRCVDVQATLRITDSQNRFESDRYNRVLLTIQRLKQCVLRSHRRHRICTVVTTFTTLKL